MHNIIFFNFSSISDFSAGSLLASKILTVGKILQLSADHHAGWPLCKLWEHRFSVPDLVIKARDQCMVESGVTEGGKNTASFVFRNLRSDSIFVSLWKLHSGGQGETKREPDTNLLRNVCRPLFWLIDICRISQPKLLSWLVFLVCKFFTRGKNADWLT